VSGGGSPRAGAGSGSAPTAVRAGGRGGSGGTAGRAGRAPGRLLAVSQVRRPGGAEVILLRVLARLCERGWSVLLATPGPGAVREAARAKRIPVTRVPVSAGRMARGSLAALGGAAALAVLARRFGAEAVYLDGRLTQRLVPGLALARVAALVHVHDLLGPADGSRLWDRWPFTRWVGGMMVDSRAVGARLEAHGFDPATIHNVRVAVELDRPRAEPAPAWVHDGEERVGCVGRIEPRKGTLDLLRAAPELLARRPRARIVVVGDDDFGVAPGYLREARRLAADPALGGRVELVGARPEAHRLMGWFDVLAFPTREEPGGTVAAEALAAGVPVVASNVGGLPEVVTDGRTGRLVAPGDPSALAAALAETLAGDRVAMAAAARQDARRFSAERSADVVEEALWPLLRR